MSIEKWEGSKFREWLIRRVAESRWPRYRDDTLEEIAQRIGVQVSVLEEAQALLDHRMKELSRGKIRLGVPKADGSTGPDLLKPRYTVFLEPPLAINRDWEAVRDARQLSNSTLLRSVVHHMLRLTWQPEWLSERRRYAWRYKGEWLGQEDIRKHAYRIKCDVNYAVDVALTRRATSTGTTAGAICRWGVTSLLESKLRSLQIVSTTETLYKDPTEYCLTPTIVTEEPHARSG